MTRKIIVAIALFCMYSLAFGQEYADVTGDSKLKFPGDFFYKKDYRVQWWYFTGHLFDEEEREFGYELTFFVINVQQREYKSRFGVEKIYISHFAISDVQEKKFYFFDEADSGAYGFAGAEVSRLKVWVDENKLEGTIDRMHIQASGENAKLDLQLIPEKPFVLNGENGYSRKSEESPLLASLYFSYTHLKTNGTLTINNKDFIVMGKSWFDREISSRGLGQSLAGWDWFAIQLDDNREIMLYILRKTDGSIDRYSSATFIYPDGKYRNLPSGDFSVSVLSRYKSEETGARYPSQWEIRVPSENVEIRVIPLIEDQEVLAYNSTGNHYWEGTCKVEGSANGRAYVEMTGY